MSQFCSFKIGNKIQYLLKTLNLIQGGIEKIPPHHTYQIYHSLSERDDCTPPKCGELSEYTDSAHTDREDPSLGSMNGSNMRVTKQKHVGEQSRIWEEITDTENVSIYINIMDINKEGRKKCFI